MFENSDKILTFVVDFETLDDAFLPLENSSKFFPILRFYGIKRIGKNFVDFSRGKKASSKVLKLTSHQLDKSKNFQTQ